jgi:hypothetical protein
MLSLLTVVLTKAEWNVLSGVFKFALLDYPHSTRASNY